MPRPGSRPRFQERDRGTPTGILQRGAVESGCVMASTVMAMAATLLLLLVGRLVFQIIAGGRWMLERSPLWPAIARWPLAVALAASIGGASATLAIGAGTVSLILAGIAAGLACLLLAAATPLMLASATAPDTSQMISRRLRRFHARAGRNTLDAIWGEVVLGAGLLIVPPFLAALADTRATPLALLIYATAIGATRTPLVDFEHGDSHYAFFRPRIGATRAERRGLGALRWFAQQPLALVSGRVPYWYAVQHVAVHHAENNGLADTQSTAPYDRASFAGFAVCAQRFALSGLVPLDVLRYLIARRRTKPLRRLCRGYCIYLAWLGFLCALDPRVVLVLIGVRYVSLVADAASFFQEHGLVAPDQPEAVLTSALHYINGNAHGSRGEDLHIEHHLRPGLHWSEYMVALSSRLTDYARHRAIGFHDGPGQLRFYYRCLWRQDFIGLARHVHVFGGESMSQLEIARLLEARTAPAGPRPWQSPPAWIERSAGRLAARII
jgi:fatty acid desaturase